MKKAIDNFASLSRVQCNMMHLVNKTQRCEWPLLFSQKDAVSVSYRLLLTHVSN